MDNWIDLTNYGIAVAGLMVVLMGHIMTGPFHISIRTRRTDSGSEIVVTDNGCGFAPADGNEPHIALKNIRQRLDLKCGGSLNISPGEEGGTVVTIIIPDNST